MVRRKPAVPVTGFSSETTLHPSENAAWDIHDPITLGIFLYAVIHIGRRYRGIKPPKPKPRRPRE